MIQPFESHGAIKDEKWQVVQNAKSPLLVDSYLQGSRNLEREAPVQSMTWIRSQTVFR